MKQNETNLLQYNDCLTRNKADYSESVDYYLDIPLSQIDEYMGKQGACDYGCVYYFYPYFWNTFHLHTSPK